MTSVHPSVKSKALIKGFRKTDACNALTLLGIKIGNADIRGTDVRCQQSVLLQ
ncbi:hypothetical protein ACK9YZ_09395 [Rhizobium sp. ZK1]|uniref:hypothetical protein n=1 Tax=Rhizobium sp. ZK1 TaxID=3389872 RepID=UPI0039F64F7A